MSPDDVYRFILEGTKKTKHQGVLCMIRFRLLLFIFRRQNVVSSYTPLLQVDIPSIRTKHYTLTHIERTSLPADLYPGGYSLGHYVGVHRRSHHHFPRSEFNVKCTYYKIIMIKVLMRSRGYFPRFSLFCS